VKKKKRQASELADVASDLEAEIAELESLTGRISRVELNSQKNIVRAAELLKEASDSHERFITYLRTLIESVEQLRHRQNASAATLSEFSTALDGRRQLYEALQQRFGKLGEEARQVSELVRDTVRPNGHTPSEREQMLERLRVANQLLVAAVESARSLATDADEANMTDLQRDADALRQQLESLSQKLQKVEISIAPPKS
jgi:chromosome segregation ATPase